MRVTLVCLHYPPEHSGNAVYSGGLAEGLAQRGVSVNVVTGLPHYPQWRVYDGYQKGRTELQNGIVVARRWHPVPANPQLLSRLLMELSFGLSALVARWRKPDVVVLLSPALFSSIVVALRAALFRHPIVLWVQDLYSLGAAETTGASGVQSRLLAWMERFLFGRAKYVVAIHERFENSLVTGFGVDPKKISVIRNWSHLEPVSEMSPSARAEIRRQLGWPDNVTVLLHAGNMGVKQGLANVIQASRVAYQKNLPILFVLMGDGNQRPELEAMGGNPCVRIIDPVPSESFASTLGAADALLVNERGGVTEMSVPSKLTSYFATGLPIIAATDPGSVTAQELKMSNAGVRVDADCPDQLVEVALELRNNPQRFADLGMNGPVFRSSHLMADTSLASFHEVLELAAYSSSDAVLTKPSPARARSA